MSSAHNSGTTRLQVMTAFAAIYLLWGSTYFFIKLGIETIPPLYLAGLRHSIAGVMVYTWARMNGAPKPKREHWAAATLIGVLLLAIGNGGVSWAELRVPSGLAALIVCAVPLWMAVFEWLRPGGVRPSRITIAGLILGFAGVLLLIGPVRVAGADGVDPLGALVLSIASCSWAAGSIFSRRVRLPASPVLATGMQMLAGGAVLIFSGTALGEGSALQLGAISVRSAFSLLYLVIFGSIVGFTCYIWLLRVSKPAHVSTYAYVNPIVAVFLGWAFGGEAISPRMLLAAVVILAAVALVISQRERPATKTDSDSLPSRVVSAEPACSAD